MVDKFAWKIAVGAVVLITAKILFSLIHEEPTFADPTTPNYSLSTDGKTLPCYCSIGENINYLNGVEGTQVSSNVVASISKIPKRTKQEIQRENASLSASQYCDYQAKVGPWLTMKGFDDKLTINYKGKKFDFVAPKISTTYWNEGKQSFHFLAGQVAWRWREQDGFQKVISNIQSPEFGAFSSDGNYFAVNQGNSRLDIYATKKQLSEVIPDGYQYFGMLSLGKYLLVKGIEKEGYLWQPAKDMISALKFDGPICAPIAFNGAVWGIHKADKLREVVRLDTAFEKIVQRIALP
jgi:hypothetical protein